MYHVSKRQATKMSCWKFFTCLPRAFCFLGLSYTMICCAMSSSPKRTTRKTTKTSSSFQGHLHKNVPFPMSFRVWKFKLRISRSSGRVRTLKSTMFDWDWRETLRDILVFAGEHPWQFIYYVLLCLSPFFFISALLAWQLAKQIEAKEKDAKRKSKREANIAKARRKKTEKAD